MHKVFKNVCAKQNLNLLVTSRETQGLTTLKSKIQTALHFCCLLLEGHMTFDLFSDWLWHLANLDSCQKMHTNWKITGENVQIVQKLTIANGSS